MNNTTVSAMPNVVYTQFGNQFEPETWLAKTFIACGVCDSYTSMAIGLCILIVLGYRTIYLVGVDWQMDQAKPYACDHERHSKLTAFLPGAAGISR